VSLGIRVTRDGVIFSGDVPDSLKGRTFADKAAATAAAKEAGYTPDKYADYLFRKKNPPSFEAQIGSFEENARGLTFGEWLQKSGLSHNAPGALRAELLSEWRRGARPRRKESPMAITVKKTTLKTDPLTGAAGAVIWGVYRGKELCYTSPFKERAQAHAAQYRAVEKGKDGMKAFHSAYQRARKKTAKKTAKKANPTRHIPKTTRGRKPAGRSFKATQLDKKGALITIKTWKTGSITDAEIRAAKMVKGKVAKVMLEY
jgi:hypothetical protein